MLVASLASRTVLLTSPFLARNYNCGYVITGNIKVALGSLRNNIFTRGGQTIKLLNHKCHTRNITWTAWLPPVNAPSSLGAE